MKTTSLVPALLGAIVLTGCQSTTLCQRSLLIDVGEARSARKIEIQVDARGGIVEVEYHADPASIPEIVRQAMDRLHPGGPFTDAERELNDGVLYYELSREVDGLEVEAMFTAGGELFSEEVEVRAGDVPQAIRDAITAHLPGGTVAKYEEIRNGSRELVEYHVKLDEDGRRHKLILSLEAQVMGDFLELVAEIEVPVGS